MCYLKGFAVEEQEFVADVLRGEMRREGAGRLRAPSLVVRREGGWCRLDDRSSTLLSAATQRDSESLAYATGKTEAQLMRRAARSAWTLALMRCPQLRSMDVLCGLGNNAGDGYFLAAIAAARNVQVRCLQPLGMPRSELAQEGLRRALEAGAEVMPLPSEYSGWPSNTASGAVSDAPSGEGQHLLVDALFGVGLSRPLPDDIVALGQRLANELQLPVLALDVPSGLHADTGHAFPGTIRAQMTLTFIATKRGLVTGEGREFCGDVYLADLDVPELACTPERLMDLPALIGALKRSSANSHKGSHGHLSLVGGGCGYSGAAILAAQGAMHSGCGTLRLHVAEDSLVPVRSQLPQAMVSPWPVESAEATDRVADAVQGDACLFGPGLGRDATARQLFEKLISAWREQEQPQPCVWDADALNLLAESSDSRLTADSVVTPHPKEAARLLGLSVAQVQADRYAAVRNIATVTGAVAVLKGAGTLVAEAGGQGDIQVCGGGSPVLATGGSGDVLAGVIAALLARGESAWNAACTGVAAHAEAGDRCAVLMGKSGLSAVDLIQEIRAVLFAGTWP